MKKRILSMLFIICLVFSCITVSPISTFAAAAETAAPKAGDVISGFQITQVGYDSSTKSTKILFTHQKTGAKLLVIKNSDLNRGFSIKFNTSPDNDKGINHIIEHSVLGGSEKYPSNNIIFDVSNTTYSSFVNAFTFENMTMYPVCSESEEQLLKLTDIYMDAVYHPLLLKDERIFKREGLRYELADSSSKLSLNGIVYNEMKGNYGDIQSVAALNAEKTLFKNSNQGNISGGDPDAIPTLTYQEVLKTYKKNYNPSNSFMVLYGDVDYEAFLKLLNDNYLSSYSKKTAAIDRSTQSASKTIQEKNFTFAASKGTDTKNKSVIDLVYATKDIKKLGFENYEALSIAVSLLNMDNSEFMQALTKSKIAESYQVNMGGDTYQPTIHFTAVNANPSKKKAFYSLVIKELKNAVKKGLDRELVKSSIAAQKFEDALSDEGSKAVSMIVTASLYDNLFDNSMVDENVYLKRIEAKLDNRILEKLIQKQILNNKLAALTVTTPKAGQLEKNETALEKKLAKKKASMTKKQINALVKATADFKTWNSQKTSDEVIKSLKAVSLKDLPIEVKDYPVKESKVNGAALMSANADIEDVSGIKLTFDVSHLTKEELLYLEFYGNMMDYGMPTKSRTESEVLNQSISKAYGVNASVNPVCDDKLGKTAHPVMEVSYYGFRDEYKDTFDLVSDMLLNSDLSKLSTYGERTIQNIKSTYQTEFAEPLNLAMMRSLAYTNEYFKYQNYLDGLDYYNFVLELQKKIESDPNSVIKELEAVRVKTFNKTNLVVAFAGDSTSQEAFGKELPSFVEKLNDKQYDKANYTLPVPAKREALEINSTVQYSVVNGSLSNNGVSQSGKAQVVASILNNLMLIPEIRLKGGAYGVGASFYKDNYFAYTYRDSNYVNSLNVLGGTDEFLAAIDPYLSDDTLESYLLSALASANQSSGEISNALSAISDKQSNVTTADRKKELQEIKETTVQDIKNYADNLRCINNNLNYVVVASPSEIEAHKDLFDAVITLQQ